MKLEFKNAAAAEMLLHAHQGTRIALKVEEITKSSAMVRLVVMLNDEELLFGAGTTRVHVGDMIHVPQSLSVEFSTT